jgi:quinol monooxygenase YgiN
MVTVIADYQAHPGRGDELARILPGHVAQTREEPGCVMFVAYRDSDDPDHFMLYEQYRDEAAFQAHRQSPHFRSNVDEKIVPLLERRTWRRLQEVADARSTSATTGDDATEAPSHPFPG